MLRAALVLAAASAGVPNLDQWDENAQRARRLTTRAPTVDAAGATKRREASSMRSAARRSSSTRRSCPASNTSRD